jgi:hypothetical protein
MGSPGFVVLIEALIAAAVARKTSVHKVIGPKELSKKTTWSSVSL